MRTTRTLALLVVTAALAGCASYGGRGLSAGVSTAQDVEAVMGQPSERLKAADGDTLWFYPRQPFGRQMFAVRVAPDGRMRSIEQTLSEENMRRLELGVTTRAQAREIIGPPWRVSTNARLQREMWEYTAYNPVQLDYYMYLQFSPDGVLREAFMIQDYNKEMGDTKP